MENSWNSNRSYSCKNGREDVGRPSVEEREKKESEAEDGICCKRCAHIITAKKEKIQVNGSHKHTFFNPAGIVFELGCFRSAPGCQVAGEATDEFTWFAGHVWRFGLCSSCKAHLGWFFEKGEARFYGLILTNLIE